MKTRLLLFYLSFFMVCFGKSQQILSLPAEVFMKNKVSRCIEYISNDSLETKKNLSTSRYVVFDKQGRNIEQNIQNDFESLTVYRIYDVLGRESMRVFQDMNREPVRSTVAMYNYFEKDRLITCIYGINREPKCDTLPRYFFRYDTLVDRPNRKTIIFLQFRDKKMTDTLVKSLHYYNRNRLDSAKHYRYGDPTDIESVTYYYSSSNVKLSEKSITFRNGRFFISKNSCFFPSGLLNYVEIKQRTYSSDPNTWDSMGYQKMTFEYFHWK